MTWQHDFYRRECEQLGCVEQYDKLVGDGNNPGFAAMLAQRQPTGLKGTERAFLEGRLEHNYHGKPGSYEYSVHQKRVEAARKAGVSVEGKVFCGGLARNPLDPAAWVSSADEVVDRCRASGKSCEGVRNYEAPEPPPPKQTLLAKDIVQEEVQQRIEADPSLAGKERELREQVIDEHGAKYDDTRFDGVQE